ncbi:MAG: glutathione S-transferase family protein [Alphaproteobacteria bacterium]|jgi:glutathione S-transferase|nr:glutathione S-transferase family protein [Alphaproteobacteria bacterium]
MTIEVGALNWVPEPARGYVKDFRVRWALKEAGLDYKVDLIGMGEASAPAYRARQPFGQVPVYRDDEVDLFESGAIVLHIAARSDALAPRDPAGWARTTAWVFAALNSVEPVAFWLMDLRREASTTQAEQARLARAQDRLKTRLDSLSNWLAGRLWLERDVFTAGDLMMTAVLRELRDDDLLTAYPDLVAYTERGLARPAFQAALAEQLADFVPDP